MTEQEKIDLTMAATGVDESTARFIHAVEQGEIDGDVEVVSDDLAIA